MSERNAKGKTPEDYGFRMPKNDFHIEPNERSTIRRIIGVITNAKNKMLKHYKDADPDTAVLISASYLGFMKPSEFDPNWLGELLE